jgi:predicted MFS family arabinose efflux permease
MSRRWLIFASVFFMGIMTAFNMFKAPPLFPSLIPELGFTDATIGWVMSMFSMIGVVLAFPAGAILNKLGIKKSLIITGASLVIGSAIGALATNVPVILASRFIEGIGMGLISVVGPASIASLIPQKKQGLAMGLWAIWFPFGVVLGMNSAPAIEALAGWRAVWWIVAALSLLSLLFVIFVYAQPPQEAQTGAVEQKAVDVKPDYRSIVFVAIAFMAWNIINAGAVSGFYPSFLQAQHGMDPQTAGFVASITSLLVLALGPLSGLVSDKLRTRKWLMVFAMATAAVLSFFAFGDNLPLVWVFLIVMALASAAMPTGVFSIVPELAKKPAAIGTGMAIVAFFQNIGGMVGSAAFGPLVAHPAIGWNLASLVFLVPVAIVGCVFALLTKEKRSKK